MNLPLLKQMLADKFVIVKKHLTADLFIYNYTAKAQYDRVWNEVTLQARGLILDANYEIVAKPFGKFFNYEELQAHEIPALPFEVYEKMDGSLGILYWVGDKPFIATRGSFDSEQAIHATHILHTKYIQTIPFLDKTKTYLFEIIYPKNRIVLDYGDTDDLVLLTAICNKTGAETLPNIGFSIVQQYDISVKNITDLKNLGYENKEGFVIRFENGLRVKIKFADYIKIHRILTGVSNIAIWEYLAAGKPLDDILERVPDEFYDWVKQTAAQLNAHYTQILNDCNAAFKVLDTRKATAEYFQTQPNSKILFALLDGKNPDKLIWDLVRPKFAKSFRRNNEN